jgi:hypothetical protein
MPVGVRFSAPSRPALGPTQPPVRWGQGLSRGVKSDRGVTLTPHPLLVPWSRKCTAILLLPPYGLYRASVPVQGCTLPFFKDISVYRRTQLLVLEIFPEATNFKASPTKLTTHYRLCHHTNNDYIDFNFIPLTPVWPQLMFVFKMKIFCRFVFFLFHNAGLAENTNTTLTTHPFKYI